MASKGKGQNVNKVELAQIMGVTTPTVDAWVRAGCPIVEKGSRGVASTFNTADVAKWLRDSARDEGAGTVQADENALRQRRLKADTEKAELELAKAKGDVAPIAEFEKASARMDAIIRQNMQNIPQRVVTQLIGETNEARFKSVLMAEIRLALESAAEGDFDLDDEGADGEEFAEEIGLYDDE